MNYFVIIGNCWVFVLVLLVFGAGLAEHAWGKYTSDGPEYGIPIFVSVVMAVINFLLADLAAIRRKKAEAAKP